MNMKHTHESGRSMIEMLGVLAIIGVLSVGGIQGYSMAMSKFKVSKTTDQVQTMVTNIRTLFAGQRTYAGLTGANAYTMGILTDETWDGTNASNAYGGSILFSTPAKGHNFAVTYNGLSQDACIRMVMADWGDASSGLVGLIVSGKDQSTITTDTTPAPTFSTKIKSTDSNSAGKGFPVELNYAVTACKNGAQGDNASSITWIYR